MAMDAVLKQLEEKIEALLKAFEASEKNATELFARVEELEAQLAAGTEASEKMSAMEKQRDELGKRLEKVLSLIDDALPKNARRRPSGGRWPRFQSVWPPPSGNAPCVGFQRVFEIGAILQ